VTDTTAMGRSTSFKSGESTPREAYQALLERAIDIGRLDQRLTSQKIVARMLADLSEADTRRAAQGMLEDATSALENLVLMGQEEESELVEAKLALQELRTGDEETWQLALAVLRQTLTKAVDDDRGIPSED
jgi:hypothetical protein